MASSEAPDPAASPLGPEWDVAGIAPWRVALDRRVASTYEAVAHGVARHWLALVNAGVGLFLGLPLLAPLLMAAGLTTPAGWIYAAYHLVCHQWAFRSFFLFGQHAVYPFDTLRALVGEQQAYSLVGSSQLGYKVAFCERDVAIYAAILLAGLAFTRVRGRLQPPPLLLFAILLLPISVDGFTQLFGLRESTWELRVATGALFGVAAVWLIYPQLEETARRARRAYGIG